MRHYAVQLKKVDKMVAKVMKAKAVSGKALSKGGIADALASESGLKKSQCSQLLDSFASLATTEVKKAGKFTIPGLCMIKTRVKPARKAGERVAFGKTIKVKAAPAKKRKGPKKSRSHLKSVHQYSDAGHLSNSQKAMDLHHSKGISLKAAWAQVKGRAAANPRVTWPRDTQWSEVLGAYGHGMSSPVNRRNPRNSSVMIGRFPSACPNCGGSMKGAEIHQIGVGPKGGKTMAHVNCGSR